MKSLLDILTKEKELVDKYNRHKDAVHVIEENEYDMLRTKQKIDGVRLEIRKYFKELL